MKTNWRWMAHESADGLDLGSSTQMTALRYMATSQIVHEDYASGAYAACESQVLSRTNRMCRATMLFCTSLCLSPEF